MKIQNFGQKSSSFIEPEPGAVWNLKALLTDNVCLYLLCLQPQLFKEKAEYTKSFGEENFHCC